MKIIGNVDLESGREGFDVFKLRTTMERKETRRLSNCWRLVEISINNLIGKRGGGYQTMIDGDKVGDVLESGDGGVGQVLLATSTQIYP